jgi:hypothetical protein
MRTLVSMQQLIKIAARAKGEEEEGYALAIFAALSLSGGAHIGASGSLSPRRISRTDRARGSLALRRTAASRRRLRGSVGCASLMLANAGGDRRASKARGTGQITGWRKSSRMWKNDDLQENLTPRNTHSATQTRVPPRPPPPWPAGRGLRDSVRRRRRRAPCRCTAHYTHTTTADRTERRTARIASHHVTHAYTLHTRESYRTCPGTAQHESAHGPAHGTAPRRAGGTSRHTHHRNPFTRLPDSGQFAVGSRLYHGSGPVRGPVVYTPTRGTHVKCRVVVWSCSFHKSGRMRLRIAYL